MYTFLIKRNKQDEPNLRRKGKIKYYGRKSEDIHHGCTVVAIFPVGPNHKTRYEYNDTNQTIDHIQTKFWSMQSEVSSSLDCMTSHTIV